MSERENLVEAMARGICPTFYVTPWAQTSEFRQGLCIDMATAALAAIEASGCVVVPKKSMTHRFVSPYAPPKEADNAG